VRKIVYVILRADTSGRRVSDLSSLLGEATTDDVKVKSSEGFGLIGAARAETAGAGVDEFSRRADSTKHNFKFDLVLRNLSTN
jgi:hypothetical protein